MKINIGLFEIYISAEALHILDSFTQHDPKSPESGGVILGKAIGKKIHIERLSIPTVLDRQSRTNFERNKLSGQIVIDYEHANTYGQRTYLGEWHTHPEDYPTPSGVDKTMIRQQFKNNKFHTDFLILLIQGRKNMYINIIDSNGIMIK